MDAFSPAVCAVRVAVMALEGGVGSAGVLAAVEQGRGAVFEHAGPGLTHDLLCRLLDQVACCAGTGLRGSDGLRTAKRLAEIALRVDSLGQRRHGVDTV
jgi:NAD(P)H-hydrate repair Nnr-like enzyme with NAD(P)H-hydrate epimerase domain